MTTTEVAVFPLKAGSNPGDPDSEAGKIVKATFDTLNTIDGMRQIQYGVPKKSALRTRLIDKDSACKSRIRPCSK